MCWKRLKVLVSDWSFRYFVFARPHKAYLKYVKTLRSSRNVRRPYYDIKSSNITIVVQLANFKSDYRLSPFVEKLPFLPLRLGR